MNTARSGAAHLLQGQQADEQRQHHHLHQVGRGRVTVALREARCQSAASDEQRTVRQSST